LQLNSWGEIFENYISKVSVPKIGIIDIIEILLISFFVYEFIVWIKNTRAYTLLRGILIVLVFVFIAYTFRMNTILWIVEKMAAVLITALFVIFQPELRRILEQLGEKNIVYSIFPFDSSKGVEERFSDKTVNEVCRASFSMGEVKTGALIVIEQNVVLTEYEKTGIALDSLVSSQLLINIFEHNTPLHDGAVIIRGDRIVAATCYLPLSDNRELSKQLGTRHRAGVGISEVSDSLTIIVSEETGHVSMVQGGVLHRGVTFSELKKAMRAVQNKTYMNNGKFRIWKRGRDRNEKDSDE
jgi:diadenylate cyclase